MQYDSPLDSNQRNQTTSIDDLALSYLLKTSKWSKFLAILGFVLVGFLVLLAIIMGTVLGNTIPNVPGFVVTIVYLILAGLLVPPMLSLLRFSNFIQQAVNQRDNSMLTEAFGQLHSHYRFIGIMNIVVIGLYILAFLGGMASAAFMR